MQKGFTIIEIVIATAIFATVSVIVGDLFLIVSKTQQKTKGIQRTASDARFAMEHLARQMRMGEIDYAYYGSPVAVPSAVLALRTVDDFPLRFSRQTGSVCPDGGVYGCAAVCTQESCGVGSWQPVTPKGIDVTALSFYIAPLEDPFVFDTTLGDYKYDIQPRVTIVMQTENITLKDVDKKVLRLQTTVSSRTYKR